MATTLEVDVPSAQIGVPPPRTAKAEACHELSEAMNGPDIGQIVAKTERLILHYYEDVQNQAVQSFNSAKVAAYVGFVVLLVSIGYLVVVDYLILMGQISPPADAAAGRMDIAWVGVASGFIVEFIAGVNLFLYGRAARQFGTFHICLERTHRYLVAYKMADKIKGDKDGTLEKLVCIMANAPMITRSDMKGLASGKQLPNMTKSVKEALLDSGVDI
jgi:hypothetical protein